MVEIDVTEEHPDILHNIEMALIPLYQEDEEMTDWEAERALNALIRTYRAEESGRKSRRLNLSGLTREAYERVHMITELHLGRGTLEIKSGEKLHIEPVGVDVILACLKRIESSVQLWHKDYGRRGYYKYVSQFLE